MHGKLRRFAIRYVNDPNILNWSAVHKCVMVLLFFAFTKLIWISWKFFTLASPQFHPYVNLEPLDFHLRVELSEFLLTLVLIPVFHLLRQDPVAKKVLPHLCIVFVTTTLVFDWYSSGLLAAGTIINAMDFLFLMIVLFDRKFLFTALIYTILIFVFFLSSGLVTGELHFAPLFNLEAIGYPNFKNSFWLGSTLYLTVPPLMVCIALLSLILTQWREREHYITQLSQRDGLTSIYNRRVLTENLTALQQQSAPLPYAIILIDLDFFKAVNDSYGHIVGDHVLIDSAQIIQTSIRATDLLGRYGGEEFMIIVQDANLAELRSIAERCRINLENYRHQVNENTRIQVTCSIGVALSDSKQSVMSVLDAADQALYRAKMSGRNRVCFA